MHQIVMAPTTRKNNRNGDAEGSASSERAGSVNTTPPPPPQITVDTIVQAVARVFVEQHATPAPPPRDRLTNFLRLALAAYAGNTNATTTQECLVEMRKTFKVLRCTDAEKVNFASFHLKGEANEWWGMVERARDGDTSGMTWGEFEEEFYAQFFPEVVREQMEDDFHNFKQGKLYVRAYEAEFSRLSQFAPDYVYTDVKKARRFLNGLNPRLKESVSSLGLRTYQEVVDKALTREREQQILQEELRAEQSGSRSRADTYQQFPGTQKRKAGASAPNVPPPKTGAIAYKQCGRLHSGQCLLGKEVCFHCKRPGHIKPNCPDFLAVRPRVFNMTRNDVDNSSDVIDCRYVTT